MVILRHQSDHGSGGRDQGFVHQVDVTCAELANSVGDLGRQHLRELEGRIRRRGLSNLSELQEIETAGGRYDRRRLFVGRGCAAGIFWPKAIRHRSLGQRPRNSMQTPQFGRRPYSPTS